jgi:hypothetical protein
MTWTYTGDPSSNDRDQVRFLIGDTETARALLTDEEIAFAITEAGNLYSAAALCCDALASKFSKEVDSTTGPISRSGSQLAEAYRKRASELRSGSGSYVVPFFGGLTKSGKEALSDDSDAIQPNFSIGQDDHPGTTGPRLWDDDDS